MKLPAAEQELPVKEKKPKGEATRIRKDLVARVRQEIEAGIYDSEEKWEAALERLLERLGE